MFHKQRQETAHPVLLEHHESCNLPIPTTWPFPFNPMSQSGVLSWTNDCITHLSLLLNNTGCNCSSTNVTIALDAKRAAATAVHASLSNPRAVAYFFGAEMSNDTVSKDRKSTRLTSSH